MKKKNILVTAITAGFIGGMVKIGFESLLPPRTPTREQETPPETLLKQLNVPKEIRDYTYNYNNHQLPLTTYMVHHGFSIGATIPYALIKERLPLLSVGKGSLYGMVLFIFFHELFLPLTGTVPKPSKQPLEEHFSEMLGHIVWMYSIDRVLESSLN